VTKALHSLVLWLMLSSTCPAADWPCWRGPTGLGQSPERGLPLTWDGKSGTNVLWKAPLPGRDGKGRQDQNQSSPIVSKGRVFVTASYWPEGRPTAEVPEHHVACFAAGDGKPLWDTTLAPGPWRLSDLRGGYTAPTPAADGERVFVLFGSAVLAALDYQGKLLWRKEIVPHAFDVAIGTSPVLHGDTVLLQSDQVNRQSRLLAFDRTTGAQRWEKKRPDVGFSHSTPVVAPIQGQPTLLVAAAGAIQGVDPDNGDLRWWCAAQGDTVSPVHADGVIYCDSGRGGRGVAVKPTGSGDVTKTGLLWKIDNVPGGFSSPVIATAHLFRVHDPGVLKCWRLATGEELFAQRLPGVSTSSSPLATADGRLYFASAGKSYVLKAGAKAEILAVNDLGDSGPASPAAADGRLFLKGKSYLWCIALVPGR
jgi:outer membrane protein assembly factor BamB